jgi:TolA-binding protein
LLVFNSIKNPDLIYPGDTLLVPVPAAHAPSAKKSARVARVTKRTRSKRRHRRSSRLTTHAVEHPASSGEQQSYQRAERAYLAGDFEKSQDLFAGFLREFPNSHLAPDASLRQADCFLHLSSQ